MRSAEIVGRVLRDMKWLEDRSEKLVVVAHSQGAAVSYMALMARIPATWGLHTWVGAAQAGPAATNAQTGEHGIWTSVVFGVVAAGSHNLLGDVLRSAFRGEPVGWLKATLSWACTGS